LAKELKYIYGVDRQADRQTGRNSTSEWLPALANKNATGTGTY